ncbi:hypothetical protein BDW75DRAFT_234187 [Aspergillus navahoensis]
MEKCWFVLRQKHYPPPNLKDHTGPIQLGHLISDLKHLDQVINNDPGPHPFPPAMAVYRTVLEDFQWKYQKGHEVDFTAGALVPIAETAGIVSAGGHAGVIFRKSVANFWQFKALHSQIIQPTKAYIRASLRAPVVQEYLEQNRSLVSLGHWSLYMITGLAVACSARGVQAKDGAVGVGGGPNVGVAGIMEGELDLTVQKAEGAALAVGNSSDFVWAIRLTKISKDLLGPGFSIKTYVKGATYGLEDEKDVGEVLAQEGVNPECVHVMKNEGDKGDEGGEETAFVLPEAEN